jgi:hypothetical protein
MYSRSRHIILRHRLKQTIRLHLDRMALVSSDEKVCWLVRSGVRVGFGQHGVALLLIRSDNVFDFGESDFHGFEFAVGEDVGEVEEAAFEKLEAFLFGAMAEEPGHLFGDLGCPGGRFSGAASHGCGVV